MFYNKYVQPCSGARCTFVVDPFLQRNPSISTPAESLSEGEIEIHDPTEISHARFKLGIHSWVSLTRPPTDTDATLPPFVDWSNHGICGRGVLLDLVEYYTASGGGAGLPYDPWSPHAFSVADLKACAEKQGVTFREADILILRVGFIQKYYAADNDAKVALSGGPEMERLYVAFSVFGVGPRPIVFAVCVRLTCKCWD